MARERGYTFLCILTLAICLGANSAVFTVVESVLLRPLPFPDSHRVVTMYNLYPKATSGDYGANSAPDFVERSALPEVFSSVAAFDDVNFTLGLEGEPTRLNGLRVSPSFFTVLQTTAWRGRLFLEEDAREDAPKTCILSYDTWKNVFHREEAVMHREIRLNGESYTIIGVLPEDFSFGRSRTVPQIYAPLVLTTDMLGVDNRHANFLEIIARLQDGVSPEQAQAAIQVLNDANLDRYPEYKEIVVNAGFFTRVNFWQEEITRRISGNLWLLQTGVLVVLLIGCVNIANLLLVRSHSRTKEYAIRAALGAGPSRLVRQLLTESTILAAIGGILGLLAAAWMLEGLRLVGLNDLPRAGSIALRMGNQTWCLLFALLCGLGLGILPIAAVRRSHLNVSLREDQRTGTASHRTQWIRNTLVIVQIGLASALLCGSGLLIYSYFKISQIDLGFQVEGLQVASISLPRSKYPKLEDRQAFVLKLRQKLQENPELASFGLVDSLPMSHRSSKNVHTIVNRPVRSGELPPVPFVNCITPGYLSTMQIPLLQGRDFLETDCLGNAPVVLVDEVFARRWFPQENPLGQQIRAGTEETDGLRSDDDPVIKYTIVGVVGEVKRGDPTEPDTDGTVYYPMSNYPNLPRTISMAMRGHVDNPPSLFSSVRDSIQQLDAEMPLFETSSLRSMVDSAMTGRKLPMLLLSVFSGIAFLLSMLGIYGVMAYSVDQRKREIGIRLALGAPRQDVMKMVLTHGLLLTIIGLGLGLGSSAGLSEILRSQLYEIHPLDFRVYTVVGLILMLVATLACFIPARQATTVNPCLALRGE